MTREHIDVSQCQVLLTPGLMSPIQDCVRVHAGNVNGEACHVSDSPSLWKSEGPWLVVESSPKDMHFLHI